ncbi:hypothetical protein [Paenibacillus sp. PvR148]
MDCVNSITICANPHAIRDDPDKHRADRLTGASGPALEAAYIVTIPLPDGSKTRTSGECWNAYITL